MSKFTKKLGDEVNNVVETELGSTLSLSSWKDDKGNLQKTFWLKTHKTRKGQKEAPQIALSPEVLESLLNTVYEEQDRIQAMLEAVEAYFEKGLTVRYGRLVDADNPTGSKTQKKTPSSQGKAFGFSGRSKTEKVEEKAQDLDHAF